MSTPNALEQLAARIVAQAKPGEQIEAYVSRGGETSVRVYEGEVEHFVSAQSESVGIRVVRDGRTGYAYAGTLDESVLHEVLAEARDNVQFGTPDEFAGLAEPDGVPVVKQELWNDELAAYPTERKIELAKDLERRTLAADQRVRCDDANYDDAWGETAFATTTGVAAYDRENGCYVSVGTLADDMQVEIDLRVSPDVDHDGRITEAVSRGRQALFDLLLDLRHRIGLRLQPERAFPLEAGLGAAADAPVDVAEMVVDRRILRPELDRLLHVTQRLLEIAQPEVHPSQAVDDVAVARAKLDRALDHRQRLVEVEPLVCPGVSQIVEHARLLGLELQCLQQIGLGPCPATGTLEHDRTREEQRPVLLLRIRHACDGAIVGRESAIVFRSEEHTSELQSH